MNLPTSVTTGPINTDESGSTPITGLTPETTYNIYGWSDLLGSAEFSETLIGTFTTEAGAGATPPSLKSMTIKQLKNELNDKNIDYKSDATKQELIKLLEG